MVIHGGAKSGKSTALQTFILSAASLHSPREVSFYCLDYGGGQLRALEDLAHVGSVASALEPERIRRTFGELEQLLRSRQQREVFRDQARPGPDDGLGEVFLVIDNLYAFSRDNTDQFNTRNPLLSKVTELVNVGLAYGIHVVVTTPELARGAAGDAGRPRAAAGAQAARRARQQCPGGRRTAPSGRGRARRPAGSRFDHGRRAFPVRGTRAGPGGRDQRPSPRDHARRRCGCCPPTWSPPRSARCTGARTGSSSASAKKTWPQSYSTSPRIRCCWCWVTPSPVRPRCCATSSAPSATTRRPTAWRSPCWIVGCISSTSRCSPTTNTPPTSTGSPRRCSGCRHSSNSGDHRQASRRPQLSGWSLEGHTHYLIIDDVDQIPDTPAMTGPYVGQRPWTPLIGLLAQAGDLGLRVIVTARASGAAHALMTSPLLRRFNDLQATTLMLSGNPPTAARFAVNDSTGCLPAGQFCWPTATPRRTCSWSIRWSTRVWPLMAGEVPTKGVVVMTLRVVPEGLAVGQRRGGGDHRAVGRRACGVRLRRSPPWSRRRLIRCRCRPRPGSAPRAGARRGGGRGRGRARPRRRRCRRVRRQLRSR